MTIILYVSFICSPMLQIVQEGVQQWFEKLQMRKEGENTFGLYIHQNLHSKSLIEDILPFNDTDHILK